MKKKEWTGMEEARKKGGASKQVEDIDICKKKREEGTDRGLTRSRVDDWRESE